MASPSAAAFSARSGRRGGGDNPVRYITVLVGAGIARKAGLHNPEHKLQVLIGEGLECQRCGLSIDDRNGEFKAKRQKSGVFKLTISERAAAGTLTFDAPKFTAAAELVPIAAGQPPCLMFDLSKEIRAA